MARAWLPLILLLAATPALAAPRDEAAIDACLARTADGKGDPRSCIGVVADACLERGRDPSTAGMVACYTGEIETWDARLNAAYRKVMSGVPPETADKLKAAQRSWIETRDLSCRFFHAFYEGGTMAQPMVVDCINRMTAERALFLKGFADEVGGR